jgi:hypothetical protein
LVTLEIGGSSATVVSGTFSAIDWSAGPYFIKTATDPSGGSSYTITGTSQIMSVPFAMYAKTSGSSAPGPQGDTGAQGDTGDTGTAGADGVGIAQTLSFNSPNLELSDSSGSISFSNELQSISEVLLKGNTAAAQLKNVTDPTDAQDVSTKAYVDAKDTTTKAYADALRASLEARIAALEPKPATVGDLRAGGVVFWVDPTDTIYGLVCAIEDLSAGIQWYIGANTTTGATGTAIGTGSANTIAIIAR